MNAAKTKRGTHDVIKIEQPKNNPTYLAPCFLTNYGEIFCRYYESAAKGPAIIWVGSIRGGFDSPAAELYPHLCLSLKDEGFSSLRLAFRWPGVLADSVFDVLTGVDFLRQQGHAPLALVGHAFGGAAVIQAATELEEARSVVTLATQSFGAEAVVAQLPKNCSLLLLHGSQDKILAPQCSKKVYQRALSKKKLILYREAGHRLDEVAKLVQTSVANWLRGELKRE